MFSAKSRPAAMAIACFWISLLLTTAPTPADEAAAPRDAAAGKTTPPAPQTPPKTPTQTPFDYDYYEELMAPVPDHEQERLCGLDKVCMTLWKKGKLQLYKEGRLFVSDFNQDGIKDEAVILEKDEPDFPEDKDYLISITTKQNGVRVTSTKLTGSQ